LNNSAYGATEAARTELLLTGGLTIYTTLDPTSQAAAQKAVNAVVPADPTQNSGLAAAIDMVTPQTGAIRAMAIDRSFGSGIGQTEVNYAADEAHGGSLGRHAGSTFKIFVLATALQQGISTNTTYPTPDSLTVPRGAMTDCNGNPTDQWKLSNSADGEGGAGGLNMVNATWKSVNTYFAQLEQKTGLCDPVKLAASMGVKQSTGAALDQVPSFVLGAEDVDPLSVAGAFGTLANHGTYCTPEAITRVTTTVGGHTTQVLAAKPTCTQVLKPEYADGVTSMLEGVIDQKSGTGYGLSIGRPAAGKTGTDDDYRNAWFSGYTPNLASSVWVGNPDFTTSMKGVTVNGKTYPGGVFGATLPGPIWQQAMEGATTSLPTLNFAQPPDSVLKGNAIPVPDLVGKTPAVAAAALTALGLKPAIDPNQVSSDEPAGTVASTNPQVGGTVFAGETVTLEISLGPISSPVVSSPPPGSPFGSPPPGSPIVSPPASPGPTIHFQSPPAA
jgi:membrane peptidoglycan carboxypeptidase